MEVVDKASQRVGWQEKPSEEYHQALDRICRAAITARPRRHRLLSRSQLVL
jgi:hypothetical protein